MKAALALMWLELREAYFEMRVDRGQVLVREGETLLELDRARLEEAKGKLKRVRAHLILAERSRRILAPHSLRRRGT
jgi:hypothetical protein